jgi:hypothetical protein
MTQITIHNVETGEIVTREMTPTELANYEMHNEAFETKELAKAEAKKKRNALLTRLGITEEEASLLAQSL